MKALYNGVTYTQEYRELVKMAPIESRVPKVSFLGTRGVPARYGGFETAIEEIGIRLKDQIRLSVYGKPEKDQSDSYFGMIRFEVPALRFKSLETLSRTFLSILHVILINKPDAVILFNCANSPFIFLLKIARIPVILHPDGLEWKRNKWGKLGKFYLKNCERLGLRTSSFVIADSVVLQSYYRENYCVESFFIPYGAVSSTNEVERIEKLSIRPREYLLLVCRFEPENHPLEIVKSYLASQSELPLVVVGHAPYETHYQQELNLLLQSEQIVFLGPIWDQGFLNALYSNCHTYLHGHSVGGTNPSLLRAIASGAQVIAFDSPFNHEVLDPYGKFFTNEADLKVIISGIQAWDLVSEQKSFESKAQILAKYDWNKVAEAYKTLIMNAINHL